MVNLNIHTVQLQTHRANIHWNQSARKYARWIFVECERTVYQLIGNAQWRIWPPTMESRNQRTQLSTSLYVNSTRTTTIIPGRLLLATVHYQGNDTVRLLSTSVISEHMGLPPTVDQQPRQAQQLSGSGDPYIYLYNIVMKNGMIFTDGSYENGRSSFRGRPSRQPVPHHYQKWIFSPSYGMPI